MEYELYHHGIKGMKWGVRRYQNEDGSLTAAGKKRQAQEELDAETKKAKEKGNTPPVNPKSWVKDDLRKAKTLAESSSSFARSANDLNRVTTKNTRTRMNLDSMSDSEMRAKINRELLERQYNDVFNPQKTSRGREYVSNVLTVAGTVLSVTGSALGVALAIRDILNK